MQDIRYIEALPTTAPRAIGVNALEAFPDWAHTIKSRERIAIRARAARLDRIYKGIALGLVFVAAFILAGYADGTALQLGLIN